LAVLIVAIGFASEKVKMNVTPLSSEKALVAFYAEIPSNFELSIKNEVNWFIIIGLGWKSQV
jgi:hypothetical protein